MGGTHLESILPTETLVAVVTRKWLYSQMYPLMPLEVVVSVERLRALVALEGPLIHGLILLTMPVHMRQRVMRVVTMMITMRYAHGRHSRDSAHQLHLTSGISHVAHHCAWNAHRRHGVGEAVGPWRLADER